MKCELLTATFLAVLLAQEVAYAACSKPVDPEIPSGNAVSGADMLKARTTVETYVADVQQYMACGLGSGELDRVRKKLEAVTNQFNRQLLIYRARF